MEEPKGSSTRLSVFRRLPRLIPPLHFGSSILQSFARKFLDNCIHEFFTAYNDNSGKGEKDPTYTSIWTGSCVLDYDTGDSGKIGLDHDKFDSSVKGIRITYSSTTGDKAMKLCISDPWTEISPSSVTGSADLANSGDDTGKAIWFWDNMTDATVTIALDSSTVTSLIGQGQDGAWGGLTLMGAGATITKVELVKN